MNVLSMQKLVAPLMMIGSFLVTPINAVAGNDWHSEKSARHGKHPDKVIVVKKPEHRHATVYHASPRKVVPRRRVYHGVNVVRRHGHAFPGFGFFYSDRDAHKWLAFTAITLKVLDRLDEQQQRMHEQAQVQASSAEVGETIVWEEGDASGAVTTTRIGTSTSGRQCREFQQTVEIGGKSEQAYGTACLQADGSWEIVPSSK